MGDVYFVIIPVVIVVVVLKLCLICWRIWLYQRRRERVCLMQREARIQPRAQPSARIVGVERTLGPEGYTQRTAYVINERGLPPRQVTRTVTIRPRETGRPNNPNMPPTYDQAVTGKDKSVKVNAESQQRDRVNQPPPPPQEVPVPASAPTYSVVDRPPPPTEQTARGLPPPPAYSLSPVPETNSHLDEDSVSLDAEDTARLLA